MFLTLIANELFKLSPVNADSYTLATVLKEQISTSDLACSRQVWNPEGMAPLILSRAQNPSEPGWRYPHIFSDKDGLYRGLVTFGYWGNREHFQIALKNYSQDLLSALRTCVHFYHEKDKNTLKGEGTLKISVHSDFEDVVKAAGFTIISQTLDDVTHKWFKAQSDPKLIKDLEGRVGPTNPQETDHLRVQAELKL